MRRTADCSPRRISGGSAADLVKPLYKYSGSELRRRRSPPKLMMLNNALMAAAGSAAPPSPTSDPERWGRWVENACLAHAVNAGCEVRYWREEPWEVDAVIRTGPATKLVEINTVLAVIE